MKRAIIVWLTITWKKVTAEGAVLHFIRTQCFAVIMPRETLRPADRQDGVPCG